MMLRDGAVHCCANLAEHVTEVGSFPFVRLGFPHEFVLCGFVRSHSDWLRWKSVNPALSLLHISCSG